MLKKTFFNYTTKIEIKATTTTGLKNELKHYPLSEGNTCVAKPSLEILPFR